MKKLVFIILAIFFSLSLALGDTDNWHTTRSTHFIIYYKSAPDDFLNRLIEKAEDYYNEIASDLGFTRYNFWLWDNRAKIYIYDKAKDYQTATGQPNWSVGVALIKDKIISTFLEAREFFNTTLPHEMGHIIFREFVGFDNYSVPIWLDEGVASYQQKLKYYRANKLVKEAIEEGNFINLKLLSNLNPQAMLDTTAVNLFYAEAVSIIDYLIKEFGKDNFVLFCRNLRDKKDLDRAIASSYPFSNLQELDKAWQEYILNK